LIILIKKYICFAKVITFYTEGDVVVISEDLKKI